MTIVPPALTERDAAGAPPPAGVHPGTARPYTVVHLVSGEAIQDLIFPQVVAHMAEQATLAGPARPSQVIVAFLEPARSALRSRLRRRLREMRRAAPSVRVLLLPYVSRLDERANSRLLGRVLRGYASFDRVVLHCRGESALAWAEQLSNAFPAAGIVADIRGAWPEELVFARGFDGPDSADQGTRAQYEAALSRLRHLTSLAGSVLAVSPEMARWLTGIGVPPEKLTYVPCCVRGAVYSASTRASIRKQLGLDDKLVFVYSGGFARYQHVEDGLVPFFRSAARAEPHTHLLCLTNHRDMKRLLLDAGVPPGQLTVLHLSQEEVAAHLCAGDAGLLLRAPSRVNAVSCPTKFAEYLASGLPVVVSPGIGSLDALVSARDAGVAVDIFGRGATEVAAEAERTVHAISERGLAMREAALALCAEQFVWSRYAQDVRDAYGRALRA